MYIVCVCSMWNPVTHYNTDEPQEHYVKWNKLVTKGQLWFHEYEVPKVVKITETARKKAVAKWGREGKGSWYLKGRVSILQDEKF